MATRVHIRTAVYGALLLTAALYSITLGYGFVYEDMNWQNVVTIPSSFPLPGRNLTFFSQWMTGGTATGAHAGNVALHLLNGWLLWAWLSAVMAPIVAVGAVIVFLLHPLMSSAVAYATGRADLLMTTCILGALVVAGNGDVWRRVIAIGLLLLAAMTKEIGLIGFGLLAWSRWSFWQSSAWAWWACAIVVGMVCGLAFQPLLGWLTMPAHTGGTGLGWGEFLILQLTAVWHLLALVVWPVGFSVEHDVAALDPAWRLLALLLTIQTVVVVMIGGRTARWVLVWVALGLFPRFLFRTNEFVTETQMYLPLVAVSVLGGVGLSALWTWPVVRERTV